MKIPSLIAGLCLLGLSASAQVAVNLKLERSQVLANEAVNAVVTITNRTGQELFLHSTSRGGLTTSWLDFRVSDGSGRPLSRRSNGVFRAAKIPPGQAIARKININRLFGVNRPGTYHITAIVRVPGTQAGATQAYSSNMEHCNVGTGRLLFKQKFGAPKTKWPEREYRVLSFHDGKKTSVYVSILDAKSGVP